MEEIKEIEKKIEKKINWGEIALLILVYLAISFIIFTVLVYFKYSYHGWAIDGPMVSTTLFQMYIPILYSLAASAFIILIYFGIKAIGKVIGKNGK